MSDTTNATQDRLDDLETELEAALENLKAEQTKLDQQTAKVKALREKAQATRSELRNLSGSTRLEEARAKADERIAKQAAALGDCGCGCGIPHAPGRTFVQGHDMRAKAQVKNFDAGKIGLSDLGPWALEHITSRPQ